jgi:site-specific DNA-cytosine methylase
VDYTIFHLFAGIGGGALGFQQALTEYRGLTGRFRTLGGVDVDPDICRDFERIAGAPCHAMDLFSRADYAAFHGHEPPADWREVTPDDLRRAAGECPDVVFLSPPCKGFSGLLPSAQAASGKYQALNRLVTRSMQLTIEAFADDPPGLILIENVPRITSRGRELLAQVKRLLGRAGYRFHEGYHDCGEIGGLAQHRRRYLLVARLPEKVPTYLHEPPVKKVNTIGSVLEHLALPDDPTAGPMHRLPRLAWRTWVRLALIPAGGDWRDLQNVERYGIEPADGRHPMKYHVQEWDEAAKTVIGQTDIQVGAPVIADPRLGHQPRSGVFAVGEWDRPAQAVVGSASVRGSNGMAAVADPRLNEREGRHPSVYSVTPWGDPAPCVTGTRFGSGAAAAADPRIPYNNVWRVTRWDETAGAVTSGSGPSSSGTCVADPRGDRYLNQMHVNEWEQPAPTVTGSAGPWQGAASVADPRLSCKPRSGAYRVGKWEDPAGTVTGAGDVHSQGASCVADPRIPVDNDRPDPPPVIIAIDGTWHRPLTTLELAALQGFPLTMEDGSPLTLVGKSDSRWRERIGNAVPPPAARAIGHQMLLTLMASANNDLLLSATPVWVKPNNEDRISLPAD